MLRVLIGSFFGATAGILAFTGAHGIAGSWIVSTLTGLLVAGLTAWVAARLRLDAQATSRALTVVSAVAAVWAVIALARLAVFTIDPTQAAYSTRPWSDWEVRHCCLTAYHVSADAGASGHGIYDNALFTHPDDDGRGKRKPLKLGRFDIDVYEYPPPFLLLPRAAHLLTPEFLDLRMLWLALNGGLVLAALLLLASQMGPAAGT